MTTLTGSLCWTAVRNSHMRESRSLPSFVKSLAEYVIFDTQDVRSAERRLHPIGRQRQFSDALPGRIGECIYDRGYRRPLRSFAGA